MANSQKSQFRCRGNAYSTYKGPTLTPYECEKQAEQAAIFTKAFILAHIEDLELRERLYDIIDDLVFSIKHLVLKCHGSIKRAKAKLLDEMCRWAVKRRIKRIVHQLYRTMPLSVQEIFMLELSELMLEYAFVLKRYRQCYTEPNPL